MAMVPVGYGLIEGGKWQEAAGVPGTRELHLYILGVKLRATNTGVFEVWQGSRSLILNQVREVKPMSPEALHQKAMDAAEEAFRELWGQAERVIEGHPVAGEVDLGQDQAGADVGA